MKNEQWEYIVIQTFDDEVTIDEKGVYLNPDFNEDMKEKTLVFDYINKLGRKGWEMTLTTPLYESNHHYIYFKRRL